MLKELMTIDQVADYLGVSLRHLQNLRKTEYFPKPIKIGKTKVRFLVDEINKFVREGGVQ
jgi:predicted DNA-binding transcriptional regulator AlpA